MLNRLELLQKLHWLYFLLYILIHPKCVCVLQQHGIVDSCQACDYYKAPGLYFSRLFSYCICAANCFCLKELQSSGLHEFQPIFFRSFLQFEKVILNSNPSVPHTSHMPIICKFTKHNCSSIIQLTGQNTDKQPTYRCRTPVGKFFILTINYY